MLDSDEPIGFTTLELDQPPRVAEPDIEGLVAPPSDFEVPELEEAWDEELGIDAWLELDDTTGLDVVLWLAGPE